jgi:hypothetical protein
LGAFLGLAAGLLIFPTADTTDLNADINAAVKANIAFAIAAILRRPNDDLALANAQREAGIASSRVEVAAERLRLESGGRARAEAIRHVVTALRGVCGAAAISEIVGSESEALAESLAKSYERVAESLHNQLSTGEIQESGELRLEPTQDLSRAVLELKKSIDELAIVRQPTSPA